MCWSKKILSQYFFYPAWDSFYENILYVIT